MGAIKRKKLHTKGELCLWEHCFGYDGETWYTIHEENVCNSLEEICYAYGGKEVELVNEVIKRGNKVMFTDDATYEEYLAQFDDYENVENPIYPYCCFETYEKAKEIWDLLSV